MVQNIIVKLSKLLPSEIFDRECISITKRIGDYLELKPYFGIKNTFLDKVEVV